jgi:hypothetical protein
MTEQEARELKRGDIIYRMGGYDKYPRKYTVVRPLKYDLKCWTMEYGEKCYHWISYNFYISKYAKDIMTAYVIAVREGIIK